MNGRTLPTFSISQTVTFTQAMQPAVTLNNFHWRLTCFYKYN